MESKNLMALVLVCSIAVHCPAQKIWENKKGCVRVQGNLAGGYLFGQRKMMPYFTGDLDLYLQNQVSVGGSLWASLPIGKKNETGVRFNSGVFGGLNYHFTKTGRWDPYLGFQPGFGVVNVAYKSGERTKETGYTPIPLLSATLGCNYYIGSIFHFFAKVQGVTGQVFREMPTPTRLDELKITAGLGWNLRLWKPKPNKI